MQTKRLIIFDMDGTLADTADDLTKAGNYMLEKLGFPACTKDNVLAHLGKGARMLTAGILGEKRLEYVDRGVKLLLEYYMDHLLDNTRLYPEVKEELPRLAAVADLAVLSNKAHEPNLKIVRGLKLDKYFKIVLGHTGKLPRKPDPMAAQWIMQRLGYTEFETLYVGDSLVDAQTARRARIDFVASAWGYCGREKLRQTSPYRLIDRFRELRSIVLPGCHG